MTSPDTVLVYDVPWRVTRRHDAAPETVTIRVTINLGALVANGVSCLWNKSRKASLGHGAVTYEEVQ